MKLYDFVLAPNPRRVRIFLAEKGIEVPMVQVNTRTREQFAPEFEAKNPNCAVPVLELDDGTCIAESVAICRYFEEIQPEPPLMGRDAKDKAIVEMWNRRAEIDGTIPLGQAARNGLPLFAGRAIAGVPDGWPQIPELVARGKAIYARFLDRLDHRLAESRHIAGDDFTIADITAFVALGNAKRLDITIPESCPNISRWHTAVAARPSAAA
jgi:glutathione S-transferase